MGNCRSSSAEKAVSEITIYFRISQSNMGEASPDRKKHIFSSRTEATRMQLELKTLHLLNVYFRVVPKTVLCLAG